MTDPGEAQGMASGEAPIELDLLDGYRLWSEVYDTEYNPLIAVEKREVERILPRLSFTDVLDAGCGTGRWAVRLAELGARVTGRDQSADMLAVARAKADAQGLALRLDAGPIDQPLPYADEAFDLVICALVLDHLQNLTPILCEFARVLRPRAHVLITDIHPDMVAAGLRSDFRHGKSTYRLPNPGHTRGDYVDAVTGAGLESLEVLEIDASVLPPVVTEAVPLLTAADLCLVILARKPAT